MRGTRAKFLRKQYDRLWKKFIILPCWRQFKKQYIRGKMNG